VNGTFWAGFFVGAVSAGAFLLGLWLMTIDRELSNLEDEDRKDHR